MTNFGVFCGGSVRDMAGGTPEGQHPQGYDRRPPPAREGGADPPCELGYPRQAGAGLVQGGSGDRPLPPSVTTSGFQHPQRPGPIKARCSSNNRKG